MKTKQAKAYSTAPGTAARVVLQLPRVYAHVCEHTRVHTHVPYSHTHITHTLSHTLTHIHSPTHVHMITHTQAL